MNPVRNETVTVFNQAEQQFSAGIQYSKDVSKDSATILGHWRDSIENALKSLVVFGEEIEDFEQISTEPKFKKYKTHDFKQIVKNTFKLPRFSSKTSKKTLINDLLREKEMGTKIGIEIRYSTNKKIKELKDVEFVNTYGKNTEKIIHIVKEILVDCDHDLDITCPCLECCGQDVNVLNHEIIDTMFNGKMEYDLSKKNIIETKTLIVKLRKDYDSEKTELRKYKIGFCITSVFLFTFIGVGIAFMIYFFRLDV